MSLMDIIGAVIELLSDFIFAIFVLLINPITWMVVIAAIYILTTSLFCIF
jgi:hypothetical protein